MHVAEFKLLLPHIIGISLVTGEPAAGVGHLVFPSIKSWPLIEARVGLRIGCDVPCPWLLLGLLQASSCLQCYVCSLALPYC